MWRSRSSSSRSRSFMTGFSKPYSLTERERILSDWDVKEISLFKKFHATYHNFVPEFDFKTYSVIDPKYEYANEIFDLFMAIRRKWYKNIRSFGVKNVPEWCLRQAVELANTQIYLIYNLLKQYTQDKLPPGARNNLLQFLERQRTTFDENRRNMKIKCMENILPIPEKMPYDRLNSRLR